MDGKPSGRFVRKIVGHVREDDLRRAVTAHFITDALVMAIWRRASRTRCCIIGSGSQYTSEQFQRLMAGHGVVHSTSRSVKVWDKAATESFFSSLKPGISIAGPTTRDEATTDVFARALQYSETQTLEIGYLSPLQFERKCGFA